MHHIPARWDTFIAIFLRCGRYLPTHHDLLPGPLLRTLWLRYSCGSALRSLHHARHRSPPTVARVGDFIFTCTYRCHTFTTRVYTTGCLRSRLGYIHTHHLPLTFPVLYTRSPRVVVVTDYAVRSRFGLHTVACWLHTTVAVHGYLRYVYVDVTFCVTRSGLLLDTFAFFPRYLYTRSGYVVTHCLPRTYAHTTCCYVRYVLVYRSFWFPPMVRISPAAVAHRYHTTTHTPRHHLHHVPLLHPALCRAFTAAHHLRIPALRRLLHLRPHPGLPTAHCTRTPLHVPVGLGYHILVT